MDAQRIPGLSALLVLENRVLWAGNYGFADTKRQLPVTEETIFLTASVSKVVTATLAMQLVEEYQLDLDANINQYLPFGISSVHCPQVPITARMLLSHTSGIRDNDDLDVYFWGEDPTLPLGQFVWNYFNGVYQEEKASFFAAAPGEHHEYSNIGFALLGYLVECVAGIPFPICSRERLFAPLGMQASGWMLGEIDLSRKARPYDPKGQPYAHYTFADYPDGQLLTTAQDLAALLLVYTGRGVSRRVPVLQASTLAMMMQPQFPEVSEETTMGFYFDTQKKRRLLGHDGGEFGASTAMFYDPETLVGAIVLTNGEDIELEGILEKMFAVGEQF